MSLIQEALEKAGRSVVEMAPMQKPKADSFEFPPPFSRPLPQKLSRGSEKSSWIFKVLVLLTFLLVGITLVLQVSSRKPMLPAVAPSVLVNPHVAASAAVPVKKSFPLWSLTGITNSDGEWFALINNDVLKVGDRLPGDILVSKIDAKSVILEAQGRKIKLTL